MTATQFVEAATGETPVDAVPRDPATVHGLPTVVDVVLPSGGRVAVLAAPIGGRWHVMQAGEGTIAVGANPTELRFTPARGTAATAATIDVAWRDARGMHYRSVRFADGTRNNVQIDESPPGSLGSAVVVVRDALGQAIEIQGAHFTPPPATDTPPQTS